LVFHLSVIAMMHGPINIRVILYFDVRTVRFVQFIIQTRHKVKTPWR